MSYIDIETIARVKTKIEDKLILELLPDLGDNLYRWLMNNSILTGGAISSLIHGEEVNDWDLYLKSNDCIRTFQAHIKVEQNQEKVKDINPNYLTDGEVKGKLITPQATTFHNNIQVITMGFSNMRKTFDYVHCMPWYDLSTKKLHISEYQFKLIKEKRLVKNPECKKSIKPFREQKYKDRGWTT